MITDIIYTCSEAAALTGLRPVTVRANAARLGIGRKLGRDWFFDEDDIDQMRGRRTAIGRESAG